MNKRTAEPVRCGWCEGDALYQRYHDEEWGVPAFDDHVLFEFLILEGAQAGLSWLTILRKRPEYRKAFENFDPEKVARFRKPRVEKLLADSGIVKNRLKVESAVTNARAFLEVKEKHGNFADYIWQFVDHTPRQNHRPRRASVPATSPESEAMSKRLKKDGFRFVGPTICYAYMQATGMVNDHLADCFRFEACRALARS